MFTSFVHYKAESSANDNIFYASPVSNFNDKVNQYKELNRSFSKYSVYTIDARAIHTYIKNTGNHSFIKLRLGNNYAWDIVLEFYDIRSKNYVLRVATENGIVTYPKGPGYTYKGYLNEHPENTVRFSIRENYISGWIKQGGEEYYLEPVNRYDKTAPDNEVILYNIKDVISDESVECAVTKVRDAMKRIKANKQEDEQTNAARVCSKTEIAIAADYSMVQKFGTVNAVEIEVTELLNLVDALYSPAPIEIEYEIMTLYVSSSNGSDPWSTSTDVTTLLNSFESWGNSGGFAAIYDVASFWTNRNICGSSCGTIGYASLDAVCTNSKYNILEHYFSSQAGNKIIQAHELGHNWSAVHPSSSNSTNVMSATLSLPNNQWSSASQNDIVNFKGTRICLTSPCVFTPISNFTADNTSSCSGTVNFTDLTGGAPTSWLWDFGDGTTSTDQNSIHTYTNNGTYTVKLTAYNSFGQDLIIKTNFITVSKTNSPVTTNGSRCDPGPVTLYASGTLTLKWYDAPTGGNLVNTGASYTTPSLSVNTTYYVEDVIVQPILNAGKPDNSGGGGYFTANDIRRIYFDVFTPATLISTEVYANSSGNRTIDMLDNTGSVIQTATIYMPAGLSRITLNFNLLPGTDYALKVTGTVDLYRNNAGTNYPYTLPGILSITRSDAASDPTGYYYYFYDWEVQEPDCASERTPVTASVDCTDLEEKEISDIVKVYPNPVYQKLFLEINKSDKEKVQIQVFNMLGELVYDVKGNAQKNRYIFDFSQQPAGIYCAKASSGSYSRLFRIVVAH